MLKNNTEWYFNLYDKKDLNELLNFITRNNILSTEEYVANQFLYRTLLI